MALLSEESHTGKLTSVTGLTNSPDIAVGEIAEKYFSGVRTRTAIEPMGRYLKKPRLATVPPQLKMDYSKILNKPYFINNINWSTTSLRGTSIGLLRIPGDILSNPLVRIPFEASVFYRAKISVVLQVSGTPMHNGIILAAALPVGGETAFQTLGGSTMLGVNKFMAAPHVFLSANEATPVILEVPFYVNSKLAPIAIDGTSTVPLSATGDYATVCLFVMDQLGAPTSGATSVTITAHFIFDDIEFYVPHVNPEWVTPAFASESATESAKAWVTDTFNAAANGLKAGVKGAFKQIGKAEAVVFDFIDSGRAWIRSMTGLHNPSDATISCKHAVQFRQNTNVVDAPIQIERLDPYSQYNRFTNDYVFDTDIDEMLVSEIISKPMYIGSFDVSTTTTTGTLLFARPITPSQQKLTGGYTDEVGLTVSSKEITSLFEQIHYLSRYWRGSIKVHIQSAMSNFHFCKLTLARNYSPDSDMIGSYPSFASIPNLMMETLEFVGHQVHTIELPYCSALEQLPCSTDPVFNALQHGMYYIYMHQPLVTNGSVTTSVKFNVYVSAGDDFKFFGYATRPLLQRYTTLGVPIASTKDGLMIESKLESEHKESHCPPDCICSSSDSESSDDDESDHDFSSEAEVLAQDNVLLQPNQDIEEEATDMRPIVSIRDFMRRFTRAYYERFNATQIAANRGIFSFPVAELLGVKAPDLAVTGTTSIMGSSPLKLINSMFLGYNGGARFKIGVVGSSLAEVYYLPPGYHVQTVGSPNYLRSWSSTTVLPTNVTAPITGSYTEAYFSQFQFAEKTLNAYNNSYRLNPAPMQDRPNYIMTSTRDVSSDAAADPPINRMNMSTQMFEVEVPNMSPYRFVGDSTKGYLRQVTTYNTDTATTALGHIIVKISLPHEYDPGVATLQQDVAIEIFAATDDVGRSGFQVFAPSLVVPAIRLTSGANFNYYQLGPDSIRSSLPVNALPSFVANFTSPATSILPPYDYTKTLYVGAV